ncbi:MAG: hypothetical protein LV480_01860 [Methylacidiphilales bacterium]|nr:hypothetical protein [Candidatus Methylacidiphilales bacterium]
MKTIKTLTLSLLAAALAGTAANAQTTYVHLAGSTAFRAPTTAAIIQVLYNSTSGHVVHAGWSSADTGLLGAGHAILANGTIGSGGTATIVVETDWTGSVGGLVDLVAQNSSDSFLDAANIDSTDATTFNASVVTVDANNGGDTSGSTGYGGGAGLSSSMPTVLASPDFAMSDAYNTTAKNELSTILTGGGSYTPVNGTLTTVALLANAVGNTVAAGGTGTGHAGKAKLVGVVPFEWLVGNYSSLTDAPTNISQSTAKSLLTSGLVSQSQLTGHSADAANYFYLTGRNEDSGSRIIPLMEAQFGVINAPYQYQLTATSGTLSSAAGWAASTTLYTQPGITWGIQGHSGYNTGGNVASALDYIETNSNSIITDGTAPGTNTGGQYFIGYVGLTDATNAIAGGAHALTYNGVSYSVAAVQNGQYTLWGYEHAYRLSGSTAADGVADSIADTIYTLTADIDSKGLHSEDPGLIGTDVTAAGLLYDSRFNVSRTLTEGGPITHN